MMRRLIPLAALAALAACAAPHPTPPPAEPRPAEPTVADSAPPMPREFRAVWVATVGNIDWPSRPGLPVDSQKAELTAILDRAASLNLNAVILQVRPAADALYDSRYEPWSEYLTGTQGEPPEPFYDPLRFAVREAHARGLELHAWFNPYRARQSSAKSPLSPEHIARTHPELVHQYGDQLWMDPGEPAVRERSLRVILDVVRRYDVDGVHLDDYFYPYRVSGPDGEPLQFPDSAAYARYRASGGELGRDDWRRHNVDEFIHELYDEVKEAKPWVKVGISPFGLWRPGHPAQACCFDAYSELYANSRKWLRNGWVDYWTPQLYWKIARPPLSYPMLLRWWADQNVMHRHLWPGNYTSRVRGENGWPVDEILAQIFVTRAMPGASGNVHFSMKAFMLDPDSLNEKLLASAYSEDALIPASPWLNDTPPAQPTARVQRRSADSVTVALRPGGVDGVWLWAVRARVDDDWTHRVIAGAARQVIVPAEATEAVVTAVSRTGIESAPAWVTIGDGVTR